MAKNKNPIGVFITDNGVAFFGGVIHDEKAIFGQEKLPYGTISNGYIKEPEVLLDYLKATWKKNEIKPKFIRLVLQDQNVLVREFTIDKKDIEKISIEDYFIKQIGKDFHVPFDRVILSHQVKSETKDKLTILLFIADENLLQDYYDVFEKLGIKDIVFDLAVSALMEVAKDQFDYFHKNVLMVGIYDNQLSIQIVENDKLVFGMIEECEGKQEALYKKFEIITERVANYYQYNMRKGKRQIDTTIVFNLNDNLDNDIVKQKLLPSIKDLNPKFFSFKQHKDIFETGPKGIMVAYASNEILLHREKEEKIIDFNLERLNPLKYYSSYVFVAALAIFALVSIIYLPYSTQRKQIIEQENINQVLEYQRDSLQSSLNDETYTNAYTDLYIDILTYQEFLPIDEYLDLVSILPNGVDIIDVEFLSQDKQIIIILQADTTNECLDYILDIYENYGTFEEVSGQKWMISQPEENVISSGLVEVVIDYA
jgi:type IV pilus assembly protein PilM